MAGWLKAGLAAALAAGLAAALAAAEAAALGLALAAGAALLTAGLGAAVDAAGLAGAGPPHAARPGDYRHADECAFAINTVASQAAVAAVPVLAAGPRRLLLGARRQHASAAQCG